MPKLAEIRSALAQHRPSTLVTEGRRQAAVALVLRETGEVPELLFIERAEHAHDPWSGHMAFPGGRIDPTDPHSRNAAERETFEEVGVRLEAAEHLGRLDDMQGHKAAAANDLVISAYVYHVADPEPLTPDPREVATAFWFPVPALREPERQVDYKVRRAESMRFPGILVGEPERHVVWGLTYRFLELFLEIVGKPLPDRWTGFRGDVG